MKLIKYPSKEQWTELLKRPALNTESLFDTVRSIIDKVRAEGDKAVLEYEAAFDKVTLSALAVSPEEIQAAGALVDVDRRAEALQFPVAGNVDVGPFAYVCMGRHKVGRAVGEVLYIVEFPLPVEGDAECPVLAVVDDGICFVRIGGERAAGLLFVDTCQPGIGDLCVPVFLCHEGERKTGGCNQ